MPACWSSSLITRALVVAPTLLLTTEKYVPVAANLARLETFKNVAATRRPVAVAPRPPYLPGPPTAAFARLPEKRVPALTAAVKKLPLPVQLLRLDPLVNFN
ncbi:hypothetical protein PtA15_1A60 [Puccinia triticina]|uniref:Uncharacterized protein n=1 Tax=Puccinia triticina TaxID=208348 RepID=A0ABY7C8E4_9BASI|nr:uncharacterized protein PtA15_1A60 [Puccinia triticina]WAQ80722.1 hypothetical protein PtA15_1A60 [Puccinia triticina]